MRIFSTTRMDFTEVLEIGSGLTLDQNADGVPRVTGAFASTVSAAIEFTSTNLGAPVYDLPSSDGVRLMLWPHDIGPSDAGHAIGVETGALWYGVGGTANFHKWYGGEDVWMTLGIKWNDNPMLRISSIADSVGAFGESTNVLSLGAYARTSDGSDYHIGGSFKVEQTANTAFSIQALEGLARTTHTSGSVTLSLGTIGNVEHEGTGGTLADGRAMQAGVIVRAGTITIGRGVYVAPAAVIGGSVTTMYGIYIDAQTAAGANYQLYSAGTARSYFAGNLLVGEDSNPNSALIRTHISSAGNSIEADAAAGVAALYVVSKAGVLRWRWGSDGSTESGGNSGNDFKLFAYNDAGGALATAITFTRSSNFCTIGGGIAWGGGGSISSSSLVVTSARAINTGTGLTGGGDLTADRTHSIDTSIVPRKNVAETITGANWSFSNTIETTANPGVNILVGGGSSAYYRVAEAGFTRYQFGLDPSDNWVVHAYDSSGGFVQTPFVIANSGSNPLSIIVGGALKNIQIDGSGFLKGV